MVKDLSIADAYDLIAPDYEAQLARNPVALEMRRQLHVHFNGVFQPGDRVLDFTAGTGTDALYLAANGISVTAVDMSPGMIAELVKHAARRQLRVEARVLAADRLRELDTCFDGAISTFAGLNTIDDLPRLARDLACLIRPYGKVILHALNAFCLWQAVARWLGRGGRRNGELHVGEICVPHRLYQPSVLWREVFAPYFRLCQVYGLSVVAAPAIVERMPRCAPWVFRLDQVVGHRFSAAGDFFVMELERLDDGESRRR